MQREKICRQPFDSNLVSFFRNFGTKKATLNQVPEVILLYSITKFDPEIFDFRDLRSKASFQDWTRFCELGFVTVIFQQELGTLDFDKKSQLKFD